MSKLWAHLGTLLAFVGATGTDAGAFHLPGNLGLAVNAIAGVLVVCHLVAPATVATLVADVGHLVADGRKAVVDVAATYKTAVGAAKAAASPPAPAATVPSAPPAATTTAVSAVASVPPPA